MGWFRVFVHDPYVAHRSNEEEVARLKAEVASLKKDNHTLKTRARQDYTQGTGGASHQGNYSRGSGRGARGGRGEEGASKGAAPSAP